MDSSIFVDRHSGFKFSTYVGDECGDYIRENGIFEYDIIKKMEQYVSKDGTFVDIGAHMGTYSVILGQKCKQVHAFEASPSTYEHLVRSIAINKMTNVRSHNVALGLFDAKLHLNQVSSDGGGATVRTDILPNLTPVQKTEQVTMKPLDSFNLTGIELIKIDVEGNELDVLRGSVKTIKQNHHPPILFECWDDTWFANDKDLLLTYVSLLGYQIQQVTPQIYLATRNSSPVLSDFPSESSELTTSSSQKPIPKVQKEPVPPAQDEPENNIRDIIGKNIDTYINMVEAGDDILERPELDSDLLKAVALTELAFKFAGKEKFVESFECANRAVQIGSSEGTGGLRNVHEELYWKVQEILSIVSGRVGNNHAGYNACELLLLGNPKVDHDSMRDIIGRHAHYMGTLPTKKVIQIKAKLPKDYNRSSPSIIQLPGPKEAFLVCVRGVNYKIWANGAYFIDDPREVCRTQNVLVELDSNLNVKQQTSRLLVDCSGVEKYPSHVVGMEDVRIFSQDKFVCTSLEHNRGKIPQMCLGWFDSKGEVSKFIPLAVGNRIQCEKNWLPFVVNEEIYMIYGYHPFKLYRVNPRNGNMTLIIEKFLQVGEFCNFSSFRGSGSPIRYKDGWLLSIHQVWDCPGTIRKYFHRFLWFDKLFQQVKLSPVFYFEKPQIEFNLSLCLSSQGLLVPYSVVDSTATIAVVDYNVLDAILGFE